MRKPRKKLCDSLIETGVDVVGIYGRSRSVMDAAEEIGVTYATLAVWLKNNGHNRPQRKRTLIELEKLAEVNSNG